MLVLWSEQLGAHPLDGLSAAEYQQTVEILQDAGLTDDATAFALITLSEPPKELVLDSPSGDPPDRIVSVHFTSPGGFQKALVNLSLGVVEMSQTLKGQQPALLFGELRAAATRVLEHPDMLAGLAKRGVDPSEVFCQTLTAGNFFTPSYENTRLMKLPCYRLPNGSNIYASPIEGLYATYDAMSDQVVEVFDEELVPIPQDPWGYTEPEVAARMPLRPATKPPRLSQPGGPNFTLDGSLIEWDIWRFRHRVDRRPGLVLSNIEVRDADTWRSVLYQAHLSEVFVPYMDPTVGWYWRTFLDSGEYGFGVFLSPLRLGVDCPEHATVLPALFSNDRGGPMEISNGVCIFERSIGDPAWRHFGVNPRGGENFRPAEGRPATELVVRTAAEVGSYDYLIDYRFQQNGEIFIKIGATGIDAVKGVASTSMRDATAAEDTRFGTLIAPNLVAPNHDHFFNFRLDFDIDQPENTFSTLDVVPAPLNPDSPRRSIWTVERTIPATELDARYKISAAARKFFLISNEARDGYLGHAPAYMIHHGSIAYGPFDYHADPAMKRNAYIEYTIWNTVEDPSRRYAGGEFPFQSDGSDTLATWVQADRPLIGRDVVTWMSVGFHHIPRMEDWPVMSTDWKTIHIRPHNFFAANPALTIRND